MQEPTLHVKIAVPGGICNRGVALTSIDYQSPTSWDPYRICKKVH